MEYREAVSALEARGLFSKKSPKDLIGRCLALLGDPQLASGAVIHVAGTNGKGSVCTYLASMLSAGGVRAGVFTSPHLLRVNERICVDGKEIPDGDFARLFERVLEAEAQLGRMGQEAVLTYFELVFLVALLYFHEQRTEAVILETGLGGRLDVTNRIDRKHLTVLTSISRDHMQLLGETIPEIALEKACIMRPGVPCVYEAAGRSAAEVIREKARELGTPLWALDDRDGRILHTGGGTIDFSTSFRYDGCARFRVRSLAPYQARNAALALLALRVLRETKAPLRLPDAREAAEGLERMYWPARMEEILPGVFLDGAHNEDGIRAFLEAVPVAAANRRRHLLFSAVKDKELPAIIGSLARGGPWESVTVTEIGGHRNMPAAALAEIFTEQGVPCAAAIPSVRDAFRAVLKQAGLHTDGSGSGGDVVFICGSLYLAAGIRELLE